MTVRVLLRALEAAGCRPSVDGVDLVLAADHQPNLTAAVRLLHTGLRAVLTGRDWVGLPPDGRAVTLSADLRVPGEMKYLGVMGEGCWDRITATVRRSHPELFETPPATKQPKPRPRAA